MSLHNTGASADTTQYLTFGTGSIDPSRRIENGEVSKDEIDSFVAALQTDKFYTSVSEDITPCVCVDGRGLRVGANAAGGTFSLVVADALTNNAFRKAGQTAPEHAKTIYRRLLDLGKEIGGHDAVNASAPNCGCGAEDVLDSRHQTDPSILRFINEHAAEIRSFIDGLGVAIADELHNLITANAKKLRREQYATNGAELRNVYIEAGGPSCLETVAGQHYEIVLVINTQSGTTIERPKVRAAFGDKLQAFTLDEPALHVGAELLTNSTEAAHANFVGALYYNVATAAVLAGPSLQILVR